MSKTFLETKRVVLKEFTAGDEHYLKDLDSDPEVMKYLTDGRPSTDEEVAGAVSRILSLKEKHSGRFGVWLAFERSTGEFIGWYLFRPCKTTPDDARNIELGYRLKRKFWGQGLASEVSQELLRVGFENYKLDSIFAITLKTNLGSQGVMKKIGMKWVKDFVDDQFPVKDKSAVRFEIKIGDWKK